MTTSRLELKFKRSSEPIVIETKSSNKKQANANCAVLAVRELFKKGFIEKFGTRTERTLEDGAEIVEGKPGIGRIDYAQRTKYNL